MNKGNKKSSNKTLTLEKLVFVTATLNLIKVIIDIIEKLLE